MKTFVATLSALVLGTSFSLASSVNTVDNLPASYGNPFIFVEDGITFSVYPDGEFDFYIDDRVQVAAGVNFGGTAITFNSGYNYDPYVQYDDYGAIIQVENVPVYYDYYGRVTQIGGIDIRYRNGRVYRLGGLHVFYNPAGVYSHYTGFVNVYNRHYVYRPYHGYFIRPAVGFCLVYNRPYRRYYQPVRYTYYRPYVNNRRLAHARIGYAYNHSRAPRRESIYRNDNRVVVRENATRRSVAQRGNTNTRREALSSGRRSSVQPERSQTVRSTTVTRSNSGKRESAAPSRSSSTVRTARQAPAGHRNSGTSTVSRERTVSKSTTGRSASSTVTRSTSVSRRSEAPSRSSMKSASSGSDRATVRRSSSSRSSAAAPASRSARSGKSSRSASSGRSH